MKLGLHGHPDLGDLLLSGIFVYRGNGVDLR